MVNIIIAEIEVSEPKWVNSDYIHCGVNSLSLGGLQTVHQFEWLKANFKMKLHYQKEEKFKIF